MDNIPELEVAITKRGKLKFNPDLKGVTRVKNLLTIWTNGQVKYTHPSKRFYEGSFKPSSQEFTLLCYLGSHPMVYFDSEELSILFNKSVARGKDPTAYSRVKDAVKAIRKEMKLNHKNSDDFLSTNDKQYSITASTLFRK